MKIKIVFLAITLLLFSFIFFKTHEIVSTFSVNNKTEKQIKDELIISFFITDIEIAVHEYYSDYFSTPLAVYNYEIVVVDLSKTKNIITIKLGVTPQIGAHNPVGYDEIIFQVDNNGIKELISFEHIKSYSLQDRFNEDIIAPLP